MSERGEASAGAPMSAAVDAAPFECGVCGQLAGDHTAGCAEASRPRNRMQDQVEAFGRAYWRCSEGYSRGPLDTTEAHRAALLDEIDAVVRDARAEERRQVVAWLRSHDDDEASLAVVADSIERGEHAR